MEHMYIQALQYMHPNQFGKVVCTRTVQTNVYLDVKKNFKRFQRCWNVYFLRHPTELLHVSRHRIMNRAHQEYMLSRFAIPAWVARGTLTDLARPRLLQCLDP